MTSRVLVDSNVLLDIITDDPKWGVWSSAKLAECLDRGDVIINPIVYAEVAFDFDTIEAVDEILPASDFVYAAIPREAAFLAARCHARYRARGGSKKMILPDFMVGAHAAVEQMSLLSRDVRRYRTYFPGLHLIAP